MARSGRSAPRSGGAPRAGASQAGARSGVSRPVARGGARPPLHWLVASVATLVAAGLVLDGIGTKSLWFDEGLSVAFARLPAPAFWEMVSTREANGSLYLLLLRGWLPLGDGSEAWVRGLSALAAVATVPLACALGTRLFGPVAGAVAALLLATHAMLVQYGQEARSYALAVLVVTGATLALARAVDLGRPRDWAAWAASAAAACYLHFFAGLVVVAHGVALAARWRSLPWRRAAVAAAGIGIAVLPLLLFVARQDHGQIDWVPRATGASVLRFVRAVAGSGGDAGLACAAVAWILGASGVVAGDRRWQTALVVLWALVPPLAAWLASIEKPIFLDRYLLVTLPAFALLAAAGVARLPAWPAQAAAVAVLLAMQLPALDRWRLVAEKEDWRAAAAAVATGAARGDAVACVVAPGCAALGYYLQRSVPPGGIQPPTMVAFTVGGPLGVRAGAFDPQHVARAAAEHARIWLAVSHVRIGRSDRRSERDEVEAVLARTHVRALRRDWTGVTLERWDRRGREPVVPSPP